MATDEPTGPGHPAVYLVVGLVVNLAGGALWLVGVDGEGDDKALAAGIALSAIGGLVLLIGIIGVGVLSALQYHRR